MSTPSLVLLLLVWVVLPLAIGNRRPHSRFITVGFMVVSGVLLLIFLAPR